MNVLIACEESQTVCKAFRRYGHNAFSCDIQECSGGCPEFHILGNCLPYINGNCFFKTCDGKFHAILGEWDILIAHPPCTYLSSAGSCNLFNADHSIKNKDRELHVFESKNFFEKFFYANCKKICIENPAPIKYAKLPIYTQIIEPYYFGEPWKKRTCLWLKGLEPLRATNIVKPLSCWVETSGNDCRTKLRGAKGAITAKERSKTFFGIAEAMAEQWGDPKVEQILLI